MSLSAVTTIKKFATYSRIEGHSPQKNWKLPTKRHGLKCHCPALSKCPHTSTLIKLIDRWQKKKTFLLNIPIMVTFLMTHHLHVTVPKYLVTQFTWWRRQIQLSKPCASLTKTGRWEMFNIRLSWEFQRLSKACTTTKTPHGSASLLSSTQIST